MSKSESEEKTKTIRSYFLNVGRKLKGKEEKKEFQNSCEGGLAYIRMRLPIEKITAQYEQDLKKRATKVSHEYKIREAKEKDLDSVKEIYNVSWPSSCAPFRPMKLEKFESIFKDEKTRFLIASTGEKDVGFVLIDFAGKKNEIAIIAGLGIIPSFQGGGLGTALGLAAWNYLKSKNVREILCEVYEGNKTSQLFIKTFGFEKVEKKKYGISDFLFGTAGIK